MITVDGYKIVQRLKQDRLVALYEASDLEQHRPVLLVHRSCDGLAEESIAEIVYNYERLKSVKSENLVFIHDFIRIPALNREDLVFVCEYNGAKSLQESQGHDRQNLARFFEIAIGLLEAANLLHQNGVSLKEINPTTLLIREGSKALAVNTPLVLLAATHPISRRAAKELYDPDFVTRVLPYISPEQTGRMNQQVDYRSDFYSFGVVFYELLTGRTPFASNDPLELIHAHIARQPVPLTKISMDIPEMLSRITLKLLAKMPEDRYQSTFGLLTDLRRCQREYAANGFISLFALGNRDAPEKLRLSKKLFGREEPLERLLSIFEKVKAGSGEIFTVTGPPGIGKTRLVEELQVAVGEAGGYYGMGKYDPFHRNTPYAGLIEAFRGVIKKILGESPEGLGYWKDCFLSGVGRHIQMIIDFLPELECIVGVQPSLPETLPDKTEKRFLNTCVEFLRVFARKEHPLVLFLDDLQWADSASLTLIEYVLGGDPLQYVLLIGAFRDNEMSASHPLAQVLERLRSKAVPAGVMTLGPLGVEHIRQAIVASLSKNVMEVQRLAELVVLKTHGNPFFVGQFLQSLYLRKLLFFDFETGVWRWNEQGIKAQSLTDNVIELMSGELQKLPPNTQAVLKTAACIGSRFDFKILSEANGAPVSETAEGLLGAIDRGYVIAQGEGYRRLHPYLLPAHASKEDGMLFSQPIAEADGSFEFLHDRVHQAVYDLLPIQSRKPLHLKIGQLLLHRMDAKGIYENIFHMVNHLSQGVDLVSDKVEKKKFAGLFLMAGKRAKEGAAYMVATNYFNSGIALLSESCWQEDYDLAFGLHKEKMECAFLGRQIETAEHLFDFVVARTKKDIDKATLLNFRMIMYAGSGKHQETVTTGFEALKLLGEHISLDASKYELIAKFVLLRLRLSRRRISSLAEVERIVDPKQNLIMKILLDISFSIFLIDPKHYLLLVIRIFDLTLKYGNSPTASLGYAIYGGYICARFQDYVLGDHLGRLAIDLNEKLGRLQSHSKILLYYAAGICFWRHPIREALKYNRLGLARALESGDLNFAVYHVQSILIFQLHSGLALEEVENECDRHFDFIKESKDQGAINYVTSLRQSIRCLRGETKNNSSLDDGEFVETDHLQQLLRDDVKIVLLRHYLLKLQLLYMMEDMEGAWEMAQRALRIIAHHAGTIIYVEFLFYRALTMLALWPQTTPSKQREHRRSIRRQIKRFSRMAKHCAPNFRHKLLILLGEKARVEGKTEKAFNYFKDAVRSAQESGFLQMVALANELSAKLAIKQGHPSLAKIFTQEANASYLKWGALAKSRLMARNASQYLSDLLPVSSLTASRQIDYATVVSALQAISTEIVLDQLLVRLMKIVVENAGAQKVLFILRQGESLEIKASGGVGGPTRITNQTVPIENRDDLLLSAVHYVQHTLQSVVIDDAQASAEYRSDPYVTRQKPKAIFCLPIVRQGNLVAILYLENNIVAGVFTPDRIEILQLIASQAAISIENARLYENVRQKERDLIELSEKLRTLSSELVLTEERQRRRIAVDLHDRIGHALANVRMQLGALKQNVTGDESQKALSRISGLVDQSIQDTQSLTFDLSPPVLYDLGLGAALEWLVDQMREQYRIAMVFKEDPAPKPVDESVRVLAFQAARELLFNIVKHAYAHHAWVTLNRQDEQIHIEIEDDGIGLHASMQNRSKTRKGGGFGLFSIQERLKHFGGHLEISSEPGKGTRMTLIAPMKLTREDRP
ncbi:MAG: AAA family ATPase [Desulfobacterales bacterium]|nr:AAA family ATPase [Desulfobacterales bacterium]